MTVFIICAVISGIATLYLIAPMMQNRPRTCYVLIIFIPVISLLGLLMISQPPPTDLKPAPLIDNYAEEAKALKEKLIQKPNDPTIILDLAGVYISQERYTDAITLLRQAQKKSPNNEDFSLQLAVAHFARGLLYAENGNYDAGLKSLLYAVAEAPEDAPFLPDIEHFIAQLEKKISETDDTNNDVDEELHLESVE